MYEVERSNECRSDITGVVAAMGVEPRYLRSTDALSVTQQLELQHHWNTLFVVISIPPVQDHQPAERDDRVQATRALFDWIDGLPPVPAVDIDAMDRGEIY